MNIVLLSWSLVLFSRLESKRSKRMRSVGLPYGSENSGVSSMRYPKTGVAMVPWACWSMLVIYPMPQPDIFLSIGLTPMIFPSIFPAFCSVSNWQKTWCTSSKLLASSCRAAANTQKPKKWLSWQNIPRHALAQWMAIPLSLNWWHITICNMYILHM